MAKKQDKGGPELVRVRNTREGGVTLGGWHGFEIPPGVSHVEASALEALPDGTKTDLRELVKDGILVFGADPVVEAEPAAPAAPAQLPDTFQPLPGDDALALVAIEAESSHAVLSAWFDRTSDRPAVSDAILARLSKLDK
jgi:hypothetical protein